MVVRITDGRDAIRAYVSEHASHGLGHVIELVTDDNSRILALIGDLTEDEATAVTPADEWSIFDTMRHLSAGLDRSKARLKTLSAGRPFLATPMQAGQMGAEYASFSELRRVYIDGLAAILAVLRQADPAIGLELTAEHVAFGSFNWLEWAIYSHHVHTHDHVGQIENIRKALRA